ncbi:MAG: VOC family protein [Rhodanobacteraceae bacterium]
MKGVVMRVARACADVDALAGQYARGLDFEVLAQWHGHEGFDGAVVGHSRAPYHLEFIHALDEPAPPPPHPENLLVFYLPDKAHWMERCEAMEAAGFRRVSSDNPYWERVGRTYVDREGGRVILQNAAWTT